MDASWLADADSLLPAPVGRIHSFEVALKWRGAPGSRDGGRMNVREVNLFGRPWWAAAARGMVAVLFGVVALFSPGKTANFLIGFFGLFAIISGALALVGGIWAAVKRLGGGSLILEGLVGLAAGIVILTWPRITALAAVFVIGIWAITNGVLEIVAAVGLRKELTDEWALGLVGLLSVIFGFALLVAPAAGVVAVIWLLGIYVLAFGLFEFSAAWRLRRVAIERHAEARP